MNDKMTLNQAEEIVAVNVIEDTADFVNSIEVIRRCSIAENIETSWERSCYTSCCEQIKDSSCKTPPCVSNMITNAETPVNKSTSSTRTEPAGTINCSIGDVSLSFANDFNSQESTSNENSKHCIRSKRHRLKSGGDNMENRPWKKIKSFVSISSSSSDLAESKATLSGSSSPYASASELSFKSVNSNLKIRKRRLKSDPNLFKDAIQRSSNLSKLNNTGDYIPGEITRKERSHRRRKAKTWRFVDLCTWIGKKGYQSITSLYSDMIRESFNRKEIKKDDEIAKLRNYLEEMNTKQSRLTQENQTLHDQMKSMMSKMEQLEGRLRRDECQTKPSPPSGPPPPPPPPPPPSMPPPLYQAAKPLPRSHTISRHGSAPSKIPGLAITPQDIANVKLRNTKDNSVRLKPVIKQPQPLVTQETLLSTRARLGWMRPVAASTPKQQLSDLEKCLLQEKYVTALYRCRVKHNSSRSAEELRPRPYPAARAPRSPRALLSLHSQRDTHSPCQPPRYSSLSGRVQTTQLNSNASSLLK